MESVKKVEKRVPEFEVALAAADQMIEEVNGRAQDVEAEVRSILQQHRYELERREQVLVAHVHELRAAKEKVLLGHREGMELFLANVKSSSAFTRRLLSEGTTAELLATKSQILRQLETLANTSVGELPEEGAFGLHFFANVAALSETIRSFASVTTSSSFPPLCQAEGEGLRVAFVGENSHFLIHAFDQQGERRSCGGDTISVRIDSRMEATPNQNRGLRQHSDSNEDVTGAEGKGDLEPSSLFMMDDDIKPTVVDNTNGTPIIPSYQNPR